VAIQAAVAAVDVGKLELFMQLPVPAQVEDRDEGQRGGWDGEEGFTALHYACRYGGLDVLRHVLQRKGTVVDAQDGKGASE
jgi:hypothetical protein